MKLANETQTTATRGAHSKAGTYSRNESSKSVLAELPDAPRSSAAQKLRTISVCQTRDAFAVVHVVAATAIPPNVTEESQVLLAESAQALKL
jgi:hypothetical protein